MLERIKIHNSGELTLQFRRSSVKVISELSAKITPVHIKRMHKSIINHETNIIRLKIDVLSARAGVEK
jgi:hypothetical protein